MFPPMLGAEMPDHVLEIVARGDLDSEQIGSAGKLLGNAPQAFTHLALISAAVDLDRRLGP